MTSTIGPRVKKLMPEGMTQAALAEKVQMHSDALSRSLSGQRSFSTLELVRIAEVIDQDLYLLITGTPDPNRLVVSARHEFNPASGSRSVAGYDEDKPILKDIQLAYRQAFPDGTSQPNLPTSVEGWRERLGEGFVEDFLNRLCAVGVDVVRLPDLSTSYHLSVAGRHVIVIPASGNWFRQNWDMAHELAHLALGHQGVLVKGGSSQEEATANAFAADLLLPRETMLAVDWMTCTASQTADHLWQWGVSTNALRTRLAFLGCPVAPGLSEALDLTTQAFLRRYRRRSQDPFAADDLTDRMTRASQRFWPNPVREAHLQRIASGDIGKGTLAWMLGVPADELEVEEPAPEPLTSSDDLMQLLDLGS